MATNTENPCANYHIDDWNWEFLRRNPRYKKAYKAVEWLKRRLSKNTPPNHRGSFRALGVYCSFSFVEIFSSSGEAYKGWQYKGSTYITKKRICRNDIASGSLLNLPCPDAPANEYKKKLLKQRGPAGEIYRGQAGDDPCDVWTAYLLKEHEIAVEIDTRYREKEILSAVKEIVREYQGKQRAQMRKYRDYLAVWDLRHEGRTADEIAPKLWREKREKIGGRDTKLGVKGALIQMVYDHEKAANNLIENSFRQRKAHRRQSDR